jgi:hypothetical protein
MSEITNNSDSDDGKIPAGADYNILKRDRQRSENPYERAHFGRDGRPLPESPERKKGKLTRGDSMLVGRNATGEQQRNVQNFMNNDTNFRSNQQMEAIDPLSSPPQQKRDIRDLRRDTDNRKMLGDASNIMRQGLWSMGSPGAKVGVITSAIKQLKLQLVADTVKTYIEKNYAGQFKNYEQKRIIPGFKDMTNEETAIDTIINNYDNKGTIKNKLEREFESEFKNIYNLEDLLRIHIIYDRSPETKEALQVFADSDEISEEALKKQKNKLAIQKFFNLFDAKNAEDTLPPPRPFVLEEGDEIQDHDDYEKQEGDKAKKLKEELIKIIKSNLQTNLDELRDDNYELDPEKVDYLKHENVDNRNEEIINEIMKESDEQITITRDGVILQEQSSELAQLASSLGEKYISLNLKGGPKVKIDRIGDSSVVEEDDTNEYVAPVIIGTEYVEKSTEESDDEKEKKEEEMKKKEHELIVEQDTAIGVDKPIKRSSRVAEASEKLKAINDQLIKQKAEVEKKKKMKKNVKKKEFYYKDGKSVDGPSAILSVSRISSIASNLILEFLNENGELKITIDDLIAGNTPVGASSIYSDLLYEACLLRNLPSQLQHIELERVKPADARTAAATGIAEKTQFADIWGPWVFNYASTQSDLNGEYDDTENAEKVKCYICKQFLVPFSEKSDWGSKGKRSCSEMEHTLPCITAFTQAPTYVLLDRYKHKYYDDTDVGYLKLWKKFTEREDDPEIYNNMKLLYQMINEYDDFNEEKIKTLLDILMSAFKEHCETYKRSVRVSVDENTFNWVIEVIKYWLFEFSYAHHICNQVKSNRDIEDKKEMTRYLNDTENRWRGSPDKKGKPLGQDNIDIAEAMFIDASRDITLERDKIKKNLKARFDMMRLYSGKKGKTQTEGTIRKNYKNITSIEPEKLDKDNHDIMSIMVTKGLILMYKHYKKEQLKKDKKASSSSSSKPLPTKKKQPKITKYTSSQSVFKRLYENSTANSRARQGQRTTGPRRTGRGGTIKRKENKRKQRTIKRKEKKNRKQRTIKRKHNKRKQRTIKRKHNKR